jgi:deoxyribonuclease-4
MALLGAHMSISGGFHKAAEAAGELNMDCLQIFTAAPQKWPILGAKTAGKSTKKNNQQPIDTMTHSAVTAFTAAVSSAQLQHTLSHASYLINLASPDDALWTKSIDALSIELERAGQLKIPWVVVHPGSYTTSTPTAGISRIAVALNQINEFRSDRSAGVLLENTAGQGTNLGWTFQQIADIISLTSNSNRLGVCLDTCHAFAAGYAIDRPSGWQRMLGDIEATFGFDKLKALHLNDSKRECGSRVDRHEHIGLGHIGCQGFRRVLRSRKIGHLPMYLETPKAAIDGEEGDARNLRVLRELAG